MAKKILILANYDIGLYKFRRELISRLCDDYEVIISVPKGNYTEKLEALGARVVFCSLSRRGLNPIQELRLLNSYKRLMRTEKPDVVLSYTIKPNVYGGMASSRLKIPFLPNVTGLGTTIENGGMASRISLFLYKLGLRKAFCAFFQNESNENFFRDKGIYNGRAVLIPGSGVNIHDFELLEYPPIVDSVKFLFIGRVMRDKGIDELLFTIRELRRKGYSVNLDIVGELDDNYNLNLSQDDCIHFHGLQDDVRPFIKDAHCIVLPSYHEGMANVLLEAAASGRPVIASNVPGCRETFDDGLTGFGCASRDKESLVEAFEKFLNVDAEEMAQMGLRGRRKIEKEYNREIVINAYLEQIRKAINKE